MANSNASASTLHSDSQQASDSFGPHSRGMKRRFSGPLAKGVDAQFSSNPSCSPRILGTLKSLLQPSLLANHYPVLHGLRFLAIVIVVQIHLTESMNRYGFAERFSSAGMIASVKALYGMDFFFVLSGFLIGTILLRCPEKTQTFRSVSRFYIRRALRILPLYYFVLGSMICIYGLSDFQRAHIWHELFYFSNYPSDEGYLMHWSWSLSVEEHFYLIAPLFMVLLRALPNHMSRLALLLGLWMSGFIVRYSLAYDLAFPQDFQSIKALYVGTHSRFDLFVMGIFAAYLQIHFPKQLRILFDSLFIRVLFVAVPLILLTIISYPSVENGNPWINPLFPWQLHFALANGTYTGIAFGMFLLWCLHIRFGLPKVLSHRVFLYFGSLTYGVYLVHLPILQDVVLPLFLRHYNAAASSFWLVWLGALVSTLTLSFLLSYMLNIVCEKPFLALRNKISKPGKDQKVWQQPHGRLSLAQQ